MALVPHKFTESFSEATTCVQKLCVTLQIFNENIQVRQEIINTHALWIAVQCALQIFTYSCIQSEVTVLSNTEIFMVTK